MNQYNYPAEECASKQRDNKRNEMVNVTYLGAGFLLLGALAGFTFAHMFSPSIQSIRLYEKGEQKVMEVSYDKRESDYFIEEKDSKNSFIPLKTYKQIMRKEGNLTLEKKIGLYRHNNL